MNYQDLKAELDKQQVTLLAVSKTKPVNDILKLYNLGQRDFGENRVQELLEKKDLLPNDIRWHLIGHLQKNKAKYLADFVYMIHSIDNLKLAGLVNKEASKVNRKINVLLQIKIAKEDSKFGYDWLQLLEDMDSLLHMEYLNIKGVMGMGTFTQDKLITHAEFEQLHDYYKILKEKYFKNSNSFSEISMGMSEDYKIALEHNTTIVRIGSLLFGSRI